MVNEQNMKQEESEKSFSLWKFLRGINIDMVAILVLCRVLTMSSSLIQFLDEKGERILASFVAGVAWLIIWTRLKRQFSEEDYKKIRLYISFPLLIAIFFWARAIARIFGLL
jgi:hypothetical protein